jgi:Rrf2 family iron-sulfur cluster assembly transcriptional regulator
LEKNRGPVSINVLAEAESISTAFLEQIFFKLRKAGIVDSVRGPGGGFCFARALDSVTVKQILDAAGEDLNVTACDKHNADCARIGECLSHEVWTHVTELVNNYFTGITLASIISRHDTLPIKTKNPPPA